MVFVGLGGILGAVARFQLGKWISDKTSAAIPLGTLIINLSGSFVLGLIAILYQQNIIPEWAWLLGGTGFLGAYTTFSTFGYEVMLLIQKKDTKNARLYVSVSIILGFVFAWMGEIVANGFFRLF